MGAADQAADAQLREAVHGLAQRPGAAGCLDRVADASAGDRATAPADVRRVAEDLSFRKAAQRLPITQPALSRQIRGLERPVGYDLFRRSSAGLI